MQNALTEKIVLHGDREQIVNADVGSDYHFPAERSPKEIVDAILRGKQGEVIFLLGDIFEADHGENTSDAINEILFKLASAYEVVVFTPGNHDLRGREDPWSDFESGRKIIIPKPQTVVANIYGVRVLVASVFYDLALIDPSSVGLTMEQVLEFYSHKIDDGRLLLGGDLSRFPGLTEQAARLLSCDIDVVATHTLPHPAPALFRVPVLTDEHRELEHRTGVPFISDAVGDEKGGKRRGISAEEFRRYWNIKSILMGSNLINHRLSNPRNGLIALYGHNHRHGDRLVRAANGAEVRLFAHQPYPQR